MKYIITSDFHLKYKENADDLARRQRVEAFLLSLVGQIDGLVLAGDVFDFWMEWNKVIIKNYFTVLKVFSLLKDAGTRLVFLTGNHDFWLGEFLQNTIGFEIYENNFTDCLNGKKIFVSHGDLYTKNDLRYKVYRRCIRQKFIHKIALLLHPDLALSVSNLFSRTSRLRKDGTEVAKKKEEGHLQKAKELSKDYDLIVFGHSHNPLRMQFDESIYINCGDWLSHDSYCYFDEETIELRQYKKEME